MSSCVEVIEGMALAHEQWSSRCKCEVTSVMAAARMKLCYIAFLLAYFWAVEVCVSTDEKEEEKETATDSTDDDVKKMMDEPKDTKDTKGTKKIKESKSCPKRDGKGYKCFTIAQRKQEAMKTVMDCTREIKKMIKPKDMKDIKAKRCPRSEDAKCLIGCALLKLLMLRKDCTFDTVVMKDFICRTDGIKDKDKLIEAMETCAAKMGKQPNPCIAGANACACMLSCGVLSTLM